MSVYYRQQEIFFVKDFSVILIKNYKKVTEVIVTVSKPHAAHKVQTPLVFECISFKFF